MKITYEVRVGIMIVTGFVLLTWIVLQLGKFSFQEKTYSFDVIFGKVAGLQQNAKVLLSGVEVGEVKSVYLRRDAKVAVRMTVKEKVKIRRSSQFVIASESFLGLEKHIEIIPGEQAGKFIRPGDKLAGRDPIEAREIIGSLKGTMDKVKELSGNLKDVIGDKEFISGAKETMKNINEATLNIAQLAQTLQQTLVSQGNLSAIVSNVRDISENVNVTTKKLAEVSQDKKLEKDVREIIDSLNRTMKNLEQITNTLKTEVATKKTAKDITATIENTKLITEKIKTSIEKAGKIETVPSVEIGYRQKDKTWQANASLHVKNLLPKGLIITTGITDVTETNKFDLQIEKPVQKAKYNAQLRGGIKEGKFSVGGDIYLNKRLLLSTDFVDPNQKRIHLRGGIKLTPGLYFLYGRYEFENNKPDTWFGIKATLKNK